MKIIDGGVTAAEGFQAAGLAAGIKKGNTKDMALVYSEKPCVAAGTFTTNVVKAAPVKWDQHIVYDAPTAQAIVCNSGVANACTGEEGYGYCKETAKIAAESLQIPGRFCTGGIHRCHRETASDGSSGCRHKESGTAVIPYKRGRKTGSTVNYDHRYRIERSGSDHGDRRKDRNTWRYVQGIRYDPSEYVYDAWFSDHRCGNFQGTAAESTEYRSKRYL